MNKTLLYFFLNCIFFTEATAQSIKDSIAFNINFKWKTEKLKLDKSYVSNNDTLQLSEIKFYLSQLEINFKDGSNYREKDRYHLIDIKNFKPFFIPNKEILKITFAVGVDSTASVSGALEGDLDPTNGMYWAWQSGYINMKIEGSSSSCITRKNAFHFHIGGYLKPYYAIRKIDLYPSKGKSNITVDLFKLFEKISLKETNSIMIPGKKAMQIADLAVKMFSIE